MKEQIFTRKGRVITDLRDNQSITFKSRNKAKQESCRLQMEHDKALGRGSLKAQK